eukprot:1531673-Heterocapsa_arctica.AAC.1
MCEFLGHEGGVRPCRNRDTEGKNEKGSSFPTSFTGRATPRALPHATPRLSGGAPQASSYGSRYI